MKNLHVRQKLLLLLGYFIVVLLFYFLEIPCFFQFLFHIPCPGCGMTRSLFSLLQLDFTAAFFYHPMVFSLPLIFLYLVFDLPHFKEKKQENLFIVALAVGFFAVWVSKLLFL